MTKFSRLIVLLNSVLFLSACQAGAPDHFDIVIRGGKVLDGSGDPARTMDVGIIGDRIVATGDLGGTDSDRVIDASGFYVAPGFIDTHSHAAAGLISEDRSHARPLVASGVTTVVVNPDGGGAIDMEAQRQELLLHGLGINVVQLVPHGSIRSEVIGSEDRLATEEELTYMREWVRRGMEAGAFGLSSGPFYAPGSYSDTRELIEMAKVAAEFDGIYTSHIRDESNYTIGLEAAVDEVIQVARAAHLPSIVTHIKALGPTVWGQASRIVENIERAREEGLEVFADQYPYSASATGLAAALLPRWAQAGGRDSLIARLDHPDTADRIRAEVADNLARRGGAERIQFRRFQADSTVEGRTLQEVADGWGMDPIAASLDMIRRGSPGIVSFNMLDEDVEHFMVQPWTLTCSDGSFPVWGEGVPHPRGFGSFPRKIHMYVVEKAVMSLPEAIRSMTARSAEVFRIADRGVIREGAFADLVVFDLDRLRDRATYTEPFQLSEGMIHVLVNGQEVLSDGEFTGRMAGRVLSRYPN